MRRTFPSASTRAVQSWLDRDPDFRELVRKVDGLLVIQRSLRAVCPNVPLEVASLAGGTLAVRVPGAAWATRLRQLEPSLLSALQREGVPVEQLKIRVQRGADVAPRRIEPKRPVPAQALAALEALRGGLAPSPLQQALDGLVDRQARSRRPPR
jgi:hypothetical protein